MKFRKFVPLLAVVFLITGTTKAQLRTNTAVLQRAALVADQKHQDLFKKLLQLSRQKGWPMSYLRRDGSRAMLVGIDVKGFPLYTAAYNNTTSAATIRTNLLWPGGKTGLNLNGSSAGMSGKIAVWDEAKVRSTHVELVNRILQKDNPSSLSDHATHVTGTMIAAGVNPAAKGMAYGTQQLLAYDFDNDISEMLAASPNLLISNHSYGSISGWDYNTDQSRWEWWGNPGDTVDYKFGYYSDEAQAWDSIAYNAPYFLIVKAAGNNRNVNGPDVNATYYRRNAAGTWVSGKRPGNISNNDGYDILPTYTTAKNILTVGAIGPIPGGYYQPSDAVLTDFSSWGPTDDGRIKPDVVADGLEVLSSISTSDNAYASYSGTSMASPAAAGSAFLLQEYYARLHSGTFMYSSTLKGILIHTADEAGPSPGPDYQYGWGVINMQKAASVITSNNTDQLIQQNNLVNGGTYSLPVIASGKGPLVVTICWTDPKGIVDAVNILNNHAKKLVNDLDLRVSDGATTFMPYILNPSVPSAAATTGDNTLDNVEKIVINNAVPGKTYTITVTHKGALSRGAQAYSLLVSGVGGQSYCVSGASNSAGTRIDNVNFGTIQNANPAGCTTYTDYTGVIGQVQAGQSVPIAVQLSSCDASSASKIVKVFIDFNSNGNFTDAGELVATSGVITGSGTFNGTVNIPAGIAVNNVVRMRIVAEETTDPTAVSSCGTYANGETQDYLLKIGNPGNDVGVTEVVSPDPSACAIDSQYVTIRIRNFGTSTQTNVPVTTTISNGANTVAVLSAVCPLQIPANSEVLYTYQQPVALAAGSSYTFSSTTSLTGDQDLSNDNITSIVATSSGTTAPTGQAEVCTANSVSFTANLTDSSEVPFWYDSPTAKVPIASGSPATSSVITSDKKYYLGLNDAPTSVGPKNKDVFASGGYNFYDGNFVSFTSHVPLTIQTARLYIKWGGKITFTLAQLASFDKTNGSYRYYPLNSRTVNVYPTTPNPLKAVVTTKDAADTGAVFYLGLSVPTPGDYIIIIQKDDTDSATIFRNNNIDPNPYPFSIPGVFSITGNNAVNPPTDTVNFYKKFYYFFYDMRLKLENCPSPRVAITAGTGVTPTITKDSSTFTSSVGSSYQWYRNGIALPGATGQKYTATSSGNYQALVTDAAGCAVFSNTINYISTGVVDVNGTEIKLVVRPNPNDGHFTLACNFPSLADLHIRLFSVLGQGSLFQGDYPNVIGEFSKDIYTNVRPGVYFLELIHGNKTYLKQIIVK